MKDLRDKLKAKRIVVIGLGRMGNPIINQLARDGLNNFVLLDGDKVERHNKEATTYLEEHVGMFKTVAMTDIIKRIKSKHERKHLNVRSWNKMLTSDDISQIKKICEKADLACLFADDWGLMSRIGEECYDTITMVQAVFGRRCDTAEVALSIPQVTDRLSISFGNRERKRISKAQALGCDTRYVADFVTSVCERLLVNSSSIKELVPCYSNAPLFIIGLRHKWIFSDLPKHQLRTIFLVRSGGTNEEEDVDE
jgi:ketopantoate reductase